MANGVEGIGEAMTGGMIARAVEPSAGERKYIAADCLNCGTSLLGGYCHRCGQHGHVHRTLGAFWHELLHGVLHFEGKIWRTLPLLAWRPGELTRRYISGERACFVSPMALFLFSVFLMFAVFSTVGGPFFGDLNPESIRTAQTDMADALTKERSNLAEMQQKRASEVEQGHGEHVAEYDRRIGKARSAINVLEGLTGTEGDALKISAPAGEGWFNAAYRKAKRNPSLLLYKLQTNGYKFSWALIPLSVPFLWALFLNRRRYRKAYGAYDHLVFITYSMAFMSLSLIVLSLLRAVGLNQDWIMTVLFAVPLLHMYRQLRGAYELSRRSAIWRTGLLAFFATMVLSLFGLLLLTLGLLG